MLWVEGVADSKWPHLHGAAVQSAVPRSRFTECIFHRRRILRCSERLHRGYHPIGGHTEVKGARAPQGGHRAYQHQLQTHRHQGHLPCPCLPAQPEHVRRHRDQQASPQLNASDEGRGDDCPGWLDPGNGIGNSNSDADPGFHPSPRLSLQLHIEKRQEIGAHHLRHAAHLVRRNVSDG